MSLKIVTNISVYYAFARNYYSWKGIALKLNDSDLARKRECICDSRSVGVRVRGGARFEQWFQNIFH